MKFSFDTISIALNTNIACSDVFQGHETRTVALQLEGWRKHELIGIYPQANKSKT